MEPVLIYTDSQHVDVGAIRTFEMDLAFGADEQNFEIAFPAPTLSGGELLYIDGTEYGGIVDEITRSTETDDVIYIGRTWHGMLAGKIVKPPANANYYTLSGDANACIRSLLTKVGLTDVLTGRTTSAGITVNYQFERFCNAYDGLLKMLASADAVLRIERHDGITELWAEPRVTITDEADSDLMDFALTDSIRVPNHLVCAGEGELQERVVVDLYADSSGNVSQTQTQFGVDEIAVYYNYSNADREKLIEDGTKELREYQQGGGADLQVNNKGDWHVGDSIQVRDNNSGLVITSTINKKIVKVKDGILSVDYEIGVASAQSYGGGASAETNLVTPIANGGTGATTASGALSNLGALPLSGGTMTGNIVGQGGVGYYSNAAEIDYTATPSSNKYVTPVHARDKNGNEIGHCEWAKVTDGKLIHNFASVRAYYDNAWSWRQCTMRVDTSGNVTYIIDTPSEFCFALHVGDRVTKDQSTAVNMASATYTNICSVSLAAGTWVIEANAQFESNSTGRRYALLTTTSAGSGATDLRQTASIANAVNGSGTYLHTGATKVFTATTTLYLVGYQNSGSALKTYGCITAVRIK